VIYTVGDAGDASWLDFLSNNPPPSSAPSLLPAGGNDGASWERDSFTRRNGGSPTDPSQPSSSNTSKVGSPARRPNKRPRVDSDWKSETAGDAEMNSPMGAPPFAAKDTTDAAKIGLESRVDEAPDLAD
jgi:hypothetical protein